MIKTNLHVPHTALLQLAKVFITSSPPPLHLLPNNMLNRKEEKSMDHRVP